MWFKKLVKGFAILMLGFVALIGFGILASLAKDRDYHVNYFQPGVVFVRQFRSAHGRLPTVEEFDNWCSQNEKLTDVHFVTPASFDAIFRKKGDQSPDDFCLRIWRGECWEYYLSWKDSYEKIFP